MSRRYVIGCAAVHPDMRGGQHAAACAGVLAIDDDAGIGVLANQERSRFKNRLAADELLTRLVALAATKAAT